MNRRYRTPLRQRVPVLAIFLAAFFSVLIQASESNAQENETEDDDRQENELQENDPPAPQREAENETEAEDPSEPVLVAPQLVSDLELVLPTGTELPDDQDGVLLLLTIDREGQIADTEVLEGINAEVDGRVLETLRSAEFFPATRDGEPVPARIQFRFRVQTTAPEDGPETDAPPVTQNEESNLSMGEETVDTNEIELAPADEVEDLQGFGAVASVERPEAGAASRITLTGDELVTVPGTFGEPLRVVATLPGVARSPFGLGFFVVRGASFQNTGFFVDGFPVPLLYHLGAGPAVLSSRFVESLDFYAGGYPVRQGRFTGGVISLETSAPDVEDFRLELEVDLLRASVLTVIPFDEGRGAVSAALRRSYYELFLPLIIDGVELSYTDWQLRVDYDVTDALSVSAFYFGSQDQLDVSQAIGAGVSDDTSSTGLGYGFQRLIGKLVLRLPDNHRLTYSATYGFDETDISRADPSGGDLQTNLTGDYLGQRLEGVFPWSESLQTLLGIDMLAVRYDVRTTFPTPSGIGRFPQPKLDIQTSEITVQPTVFTIAPYVEQVFRLGDFELAAGLRLEYLRYARVSRLEFDPRGVLRYTPTEALTLKLASGLFTQPPQPFQIDFDFGNPTLSPSRSWQNSIGIELELPYELEIQSTVFYNRMSGIARNTSDFVPDESGEGFRRQIYAADGEGQSYGMELLVRRENEEGLYGWLSYTLAWSERFLDDGETIPFFFDVRHTLNIAASYAIGGWRFGGRFSVSSGRPDRPVLGTDLDFDRDRIIPIRGGLTDRQPVYTQLDLRIDRDFTLGDHIKGSVYIDVLNVLNAPNAEGTVYQYDFQQSRPLPGLPIIGTIGIRGAYE